MKRQGWCKWSCMKLGSLSWHSSSSLVPSLLRNYQKPIFCPHKILSTVTSLVIPWKYIIKQYISVRKHYTDTDIQLLWSEHICKSERTKQTNYTYLASVAAPLPLSKRMLRGKSSISGFPTLLEQEMKLLFLFAFPTKDSGSVSICSDETSAPGNKLIVVVGLL